MPRSIARRASAVLGAIALGAVAVFGSAVPASAVDGNIDEDAFRSLTIHKHAIVAGSTSTNGTGQELPTAPPAPLAGAQFTAALVADVELTTSAGWTTANSLTPASAAGRLEGTVFTSTVTGTDGVATFETDDPDGLPIGLYLVTETVLPEDATNPAAPFLVTLPTPTGPSGAPANEWIYDVHVYPKNAVTDVTKTRVPAPANSAEARNPDLIRWAIAAAIPTLAPGDTIGNFVLSDTIPAELEYVATPPTGVAPSTVTVTNAAGLPQTFVANTDYTITTSGATSSLTFTAAGLTRLAGLQGGVVTYEVLTRAVAIPPSGVIVNTATGIIDGAEETVTGSTPIGQLTVFAYSSAPGVTERAPLAGAVYRVYLTQDDANRDINPVLIGGQTDWTTGADGFVEIPIITPGNYWVREITAPAGFQLPTPSQVVTQVVAGETSTVAPVQNYLEFAHSQVPAFLLPVTGGDGALWFGVGGGALLLVVIGAAVLTARRRSVLAHEADAAAPTATA